MISEQVTSDAAPLLDRPAGFTLPAGIPVIGVKTVDRLGQNLGAGCLTCAPASAEQVRMRNPSGLNLIPEGTDDHILSPYIIKDPGTVGSV